MIKIHTDLNLVARGSEMNPNTSQLNQDYHDHFSCKQGLVAKWVHSFFQQQRRVFG